MQEAPAALDQEVTSHKELEEADQRQEHQSWPFSLTALLEKLPGKILRHAAPSCAVGRGKQAEDTDNQEAIENEDLILAALRVPPIPQVHKRQVGHSPLACSCR